MNPALRISQLIDLYQTIGNTAYLVEAKAIALCLHEQGCEAYAGLEKTHKGDVGKQTMEVA